MAVDIIAHYLHIAAAIFWIGGTVFVSFVLVPVLKAHTQFEQRILLMRDIGRKFMMIAWMAVATLLVTGLIRLRGVFANPEILQGRFGFILAVKIILFFLAVYLGILHDFLWGPKLSRSTLSAASREFLRRKIVALARVHLGLVLVIALLCVLLRFNPF